MTSRIGAALIAIALAACGEETPVETDAAPPPCSDLACEATPICTPDSYCSCRVGDSFINCHRDAPDGDARTGRDARPSEDAAGG